MSPTVHDAPVSTIAPATLYRILALRCAVFVVEQDCVYLDLDLRDLETDARQLWIEDGDAVVATLRLLIDPDGAARIGRVATDVGARGRGLAALLVRRAMQLSGARDIVLDAQSYLYDWYAGFGFTRDGDDFIEDGIPHVPMRRPSA